MKVSNYHLKFRHFIIVILLIISFGLLFSKFLYMEIIQQQKLKQEGDNRSDRNIKIESYRGMILDRNGNPLAISTPVDTIWVDPFYIKASSLKLNEILRMLDLSEVIQKHIKSQIKKREGRSGFVYIKRKIQPYLSQKINSMGVVGVHIVREFKRYYPLAEVTSHIIGFVNVDGKGQEGLELSFNGFLTGQDGYFKYKKDLHGGVAFKDEDKFVEPKNGKNLQLSIDSSLQYIAYKYLKKGVINSNSDAGSVIIENVQTGEILAMASYPSYNPNSMADVFPENLRNRAITDVFEPGSVMKIFSAATALTYGHDYTPEDPIVNTHPGHYHIGKNTVRDFRDYGEIDLRHILMKSSNVGISQIIIGLIDPNILGISLCNFGFGYKTGIELPGEREGFIPVKDKCSNFQLATLSFGYGMNATDIQLVSGVSIIANDGKYVKPTILKRRATQKVNSRSIISKKVSKEMVSMMQSVVEDLGGTGSKGTISLYHVAGKTGTARKLLDGAYSANYLASFIGITPASNPNIAIVVTIDNPKSDSYSGGAVAAPVFANIARNALQVIGVKPDKI